MRENERLGVVVRARLGILALLGLIAAIGCNAPGGFDPGEPGDEVKLGRKTAALSAPVVHGFEDGTTQGWVPRGPVTLTNTAAVAFEGTRSLLTTGRTAGFHGPSLNALPLLTRGATYQVTVSVRLLAGQAPTTVRLTMQRTPVGAGNAFDTVAQNTNVTDAAWVTLSANYSFAGDVSGLLLYVEATTATASYYIDGFNITELSPPPGPPGNEDGAFADFESNTPEGWASRTGVEVLTVTTADAHTGTHSLLTTGRTNTFRGPSLNVTNVMFNGSRYRISLWAKLAPGEADTQLRLSVERRLGTQQTFHTVVGNTVVTAGGWVRLVTTFDLALAHTSLTLYVESNAGLASFYIDDFELTFVPPAAAQRDIPSVHESLDDFFPVGAAIFQGDLTGERAVLLTRHFDSVTSENDMKWDALQPSEGNFTFAAADAQLAFARARQLNMRGHTLIWHAQTPAYVFTAANGSPMTPSPENKELLLARLTNHIRTVMLHFGPDVGTWDVVNEVIDPAQADGFRRSPWFNIIGPEFIEHAFRVAREVAPNAKLYINEFDTVNATKRTFLRNLVADLRSRGVPVDGVGHQMHNNVDFPSAQAIIDTINLFDALGVENEITELDVSIYSGSLAGPIVDYFDIPESRLVSQGYRYRTFFQAFRQLAGKINSVTFWGTADDHTWLTSAGRVDAPLLFDRQLKAKHAYWGVVDPLQLPGADLAVSIDASGASAPSGTAVQYAIGVRNEADADLENFLPSDDDLPAQNPSLTLTLPAGLGFRSFTAPAEWACTTPAVGASGVVRCTAAVLGVDAEAQFALEVSAGTCATPNGSALSVSASVTAATADPNLAPNNAASASVSISNSAPVITLQGAGGGSVECATPFTDPGALAVDECEGSVAVTATGVVDPSRPGTYVVRYSATDQAGNVTTLDRSVVVTDTVAPVIDLQGLRVLLPGLEIVLTGEALVVGGRTFPLRIGSFEVAGHTIAFDGQVIRVDGQVVNLEGGTILLIPPQGQYRTFSAGEFITGARDGCDSTVDKTDVVIVQATSDEAENAAGNDDGNTVKDILMAADCKSVQMRVERNRRSNGRVYTVALQVRDAAGNVGSRNAKVLVPEGQRLSVADGAPVYTVTSACR